MQKIFGIFLLVIGLGIVIFINREGFLNNINTSKLFPALPSSTNESSQENSTGTDTGGETSYGIGYYNQPPIGSSGSQTPVPSEVQPTVVAQPEINPSDIPDGFTVKDLSPYFHKVRFSSVWAGNVDNIGQISLAAGFDGTSTIDVSNWLMRANRGSQYVPKAVNIYYPAGTNKETDVILHNGDVFNMYFGASSPIGVNIRLNLCTGYLANHNTFNPDLPRNCPSPDYSQFVGFTGVCQDYVNSLYGCAEPDPNQTIPVIDYSCQTYINTLNYSGCISKYGSREDFLSQEWRAWIGGLFLDQYHDRLLLLDKNSLLVDLYTY